MSVECCGKPCDTPFCPMCGKRLSEYFLGIQGLKRHVDNRVKSLKDAVGEEKVDDRKLKALNKWQSWQTSLQGLIDASG